MPEKLLDEFIVRKDILASRLACVALESAVLTHGLPPSHNLWLGREMERRIQQNGALPATIAVLDGKIRVGLEDDDLIRLTSEGNMRKISPRDLAGVIQKRENGGTTVAGTLFIADKAGIRTLATGGIGGVHPNAEYDISADLPTLASNPLIVVCSGAKAILDLPATLELLETLSVPVIGYQTNEFPAFYSRQSGLRIKTRVDSPKEVVAYARTHWALGLRSAVLLVQPPPESSALPYDFLMDNIHQAQQSAAKENIHGQELTPFLLKTLAEITNGATLKVNLELLLNNADLAAQIACSLHQLSRTRNV